MVSVSATNKKQGEAADGTSIRIGACLINRWRVRINQKRLYNVKTCVPKGGFQTRESQEREKNKDMKFLEHGLKTRATHDVLE